MQIKEALSKSFEKYQETIKILALNEFPIGRDLLAKGVSQFIMNQFLIDLFSISSYIATSRLVHNGGYLQKLLQLLNSPEFFSERLYLATKILLNLHRLHISSRLEIVQRR